MGGAAALAVVAVVLTAADPAALAFSDFFRPASSRLQPSDKLLALDGQRVRIHGFMARMEEGPSGAFYLASRPVNCDEGGAGTGDLPPDAVLVVVPWSAGSEIPFLPGPLEVVGVIHLGAATRQDGLPSRFRIVLDPPAAKSTETQLKSEGGMVP
jgi:hypothetical protein